MAKITLASIVASLKAWQWRQILAFPNQCNHNFAAWRDFSLCLFTKIILLKYGFDLKLVNDLKAYSLLLHLYLEIYDLQSKIDCYVIIFGLNATTAPKIDRVNLPQCCVATIKSLLSIEMKSRLGWPRSHNTGALDWPSTNFKDFLKPKKLDTVFPSIISSMKELSLVGRIEREG